MLLQINLFSYTGGDTLSFNLNENLGGILNTKFYKQLNIYNLVTAFKYSDSYEKFYYSIGENFNSTIIKSNDKNIRDEHYFNLSSGYKITPKIEAGITAKNNILSDSRKIEINSASNSSLLLFSKYNYDYNAYLAPWFGYTNNRQIGISDYGYIYGLEGMIDKQKLADFEINSSLRLYNEDISPRKNYLRNIRFSLNEEFDNNIKNEVTVGFNQLRRDFYFKADSTTAGDFGITNNIQSRTETYYYLTNDFTYLNFLDYFSLNVVGSVFWRNVLRNTKYKSLNIASSSIFDTKIKELRFEFESSLKYKSESFSSELKAAYSEKDERYTTIYLEGVNKIFYTTREEIESQKNNISGKIYITAFTDFKLSKKDIFNVSLLHFKLKYDTPNEKNYDDRDELLSIFRLRYTRIISPFFSAFINTEGNLSKLVYISAKRSSNNYTNRVLKLSSGGFYTSSIVSSFNSFEVSANYTVYDFEDINPNYKSYSFRQFSYVDSTQINFTSDISLKVFGYLKLSEQGELKWNNFSLRPTRFLEESLLIPTIFYTWNKFICGLGIRYFSLKTFSYKQAEKILESFYSSIGPTTEINYNLSENASINFSSWYEFINLHNNNNKNENININFDLNWIF